MAWAVLAPSVIWVVLMTSQVVRRIARSSWLLDLHRWLAALAVVFTDVAVAAIQSEIRHYRPPPGGALRIFLGLPNVRWVPEEGKEGPLLGALGEGPFSI